VAVLVSPTSRINGIIGVFVACAEYRALPQTGYRSSPRRIPRHGSDASANPLSGKSLSVSGHLRSSLISDAASPVGRHGGRPSLKYEHQRQQALSLYGDGPIAANGSNLCAVLAIGFARKTGRCPHRVQTLFQIQKRLSAILREERGKQTGGLIWRLEGLSTAK